MNCVVFLLFGFKSLGKGVLLIYVFIMLSLEAARCCFLGSKSIFSSANHRCLL